MKELLPDYIEGKGETKGFTFKKSKETHTHYIYTVNTGESEHFELFERKTSAKCLDFANRVYSDTETKEYYPKSNSFGVWAWTLTTFQSACNKLESLTTNQKQQQNERSSKN